ncbi:hypothetical protein ACD661_01045 [Legionella lytica]|uniref:DUF4239 domain-containing protein n=1 Tax=Legionella lytica TaxID=96232 RepID=A0ABW8D357_9GAMM
MNLYTITGVLFVFILFGLMMLSLFLGYKYSNHFKSSQKIKKEGGVQIIEGSMFALLGLLLAFTFSSAVTKLEHRKELIIDEANAIGTLSLRFDLLPAEEREQFKTTLKNYLNVHIKAYRAIPNMAEVNRYLDKSHAYQNKLWSDAALFCSGTKSNYPCMLIMPALNQVFDIENTRLKNTLLHPPIYIFVLLVGVALVATFFIGNNLGYSKDISMIHIIFYALVISLVIFSIVDIEYPRLGFIRVDSFDSVLIDLRASL